MNYTVKTKHEGKFLTIGNVRKNQFGNYQVGLKMGPVLRSLIANAKDGDWVNLSMFVDDGEKKDVKAAAAGDSGETPGIPF